MQTWKILLADDDPEDRMILQDAIESVGGGSILKFAQNGEEVLDILEADYADRTPCLIVLDLNMPRLNGTQTLGRLKSDPRFKDIPVVIYSTSINPLEKDRCMILGAHAYITKPISFVESMETAKIFLSLCTSKNQL